MDQSVAEIDVASGKVLRRVAVGGNSLTGTSVVGFDLWLPTDGGTVVVNTRTAKVLHRYQQGFFPDGKVGWALSNDGSSLLRIDAATDQVTGRATLGTAHSDDWSPSLTVGDGSVWVARGSERQLVRIDARTLRRQAVITGFSPADSLMVVGFGFGRVWVQQNAAGAGRLYVIDPRTGRIAATTNLGDPRHGGRYGGANLVFADGAVWTGDSSPTVTEVNPTTGRVERVFGVPAPPQYLAVSRGALWIAGDSNSTAPGLTRLAMPS
jgi:prepilin-type processing-associated H-X9-DG protein